jgi:nucleoside phosphorylase/CheY-like chemotaxis protein
MINVLILDDSPEKVNITKKFLNEECNLNKDYIDEALTINEGRKKLYENRYDLLLLDLVLPRDTDSEASADESIRFLEEIYYNSEIKIPIHIIGFSQYDEMVKEHESKFDDKLWHLIKFDYINSNWKNLLKVKISHLISTKEEFRKSIEGKEEFDYAIICALETPELKAILELPCEWKTFNISEDNDPMVYHEGVINTINGNSRRILACSVNKMGMQATVCVTSIIISKFKVKNVFMTGICAGVKGRDLKFGDVIIAENTTEYAAGKITENNEGVFSFKPEPVQLPTNQKLIALTNSFISNNERELLNIYSEYKGNKPDNIFKAKIGPIASGSLVVASKTMIKSITDSNRKILGIDMEGHGMYLASYFLETSKSLFIKSVCDFGDSEKSDDYQDYASYTSARFLHSFIFNIF